MMIYTLPPNITREKIIDKYSSLRAADDDSDSLSSDEENWVEELILLHETGNYTLGKLFRD